ncbi:MAG: hypothetical protein RLZZ44_927 [Bacteroidota bacterium]|jgi:hypothetical protein
MTKKGGSGVSLNQDDKEYIANQIKIGTMETVDQLKKVIEDKEKGRDKKCLIESERIKKLEDTVIYKSDFTSQLLNLKNIAVICTTSTVTFLTLIVLMRLLGFDGLIKALL